MLHATIIQHTAVDVAASIRPLLEQADVVIDCVRLDRGDSIPEKIHGDILMSFGAPVSLVSPSSPPGDFSSVPSSVPDWVEAERSLLRWAVDHDKAVLGICFGAQLLASALGAKVHRNGVTEAGWHPVFRIDDDSDPEAFNSLPPTLTTFHWHRNTFDIPHDATRLYRSDSCENQAFQVGSRILGLQFHFEVNDRSIRNFLLASSLHRETSAAVQDRDEIIKQSAIYLERQQQCLGRFIREFLSRC